MMSQESTAITDYPEQLIAIGPMSNHRVKVFIGLAVVIVALGYVGFMAFQSATVYFYTVGEIRQLGPSEEGRVVRLGGKLVAESFIRESGSTLAHFELTDGTETIAAVHSGILPDLFFNEHSEIILEGSYTKDGVFESHNVIVKCPSKYVAAG